MPVCFRSSISGLLAAGAVVVCASNAIGDPAPRTRTVRVDSHTGHLVRTVVVPSRPVVAKALPAQSVPAIVPPAEPEPMPVIAPDAKVNEIVEAAAKHYEVDPLLVHSVIQVESAYNTKAVSPKGAQGLMQLIPSTARRFGASNSFDPKENIEAGVKYLKYLNTLFPDDLRLTLAAYNAGEGAVMKYGNNIPPYPETEQYVYSVGKRYGSARRAAEKKKKAERAVAQPKTAPEEKHPPVESFIDSEGRLHLRTKAADMVSTP